MELLHGELTYQIIGGAMAVHRELGPGFLESIYQRAMEVELAARKMLYEPQRRITLSYRGAPIGDHVLDLVVDDRVIVELKAVKDLSDHHQAQVISYLKASNLQIGLLFNFSKASLEHKRILLSDALR
jgi:GxxExxY protein